MKLILDMLNVGDVVVQLKGEREIKKRKNYKKRWNEPAQLRYLLRHQ